MPSGGPCPTLPLTPARPHGTTRRGRVSDISKLGLLRIAQMVRARFDSNAVRLVGFTGGGSLWEIYKDVKPWELAGTFKDVMDNTYHKYPLAADVKVGLCWGQMEPWRG